jgi:hypothetical protein
MSFDKFHKEKILRLFTERKKYIAAYKPNGSFAGLQQDPISILFDKVEKANGKSAKNTKTQEQKDLDLYVKLENMF